MGHTRGTHNSSQLTSNTTTTTSTTTAKMASASVLLHTTQLEELEKDELIALVMELQNEKNALMGQLERNDRGEGFSRSNSVEITNNDAVEEEGVVQLFDGAKVEVYGRQLKRKDVAACHRIGKRAVTCKVREG